jgi:hypothetical protein
MNEIITYTVSPEIQKRSVQEYFWKHTVGHQWLIITIFLIIGALCRYHSTYTQVDHHIGTGFLVMGGVFILLYFKSYQQHIQAANDSFNLCESHNVTVTLTDESLTIAKEQSHQQIEWNRITKSLDCRNFLILFSNKLPVGSLPKAELSEKQIDFIKNKTKEVPTKKYNLFSRSREKC